ncbi:MULTISPECIES: CBS and ACT domain-containing protein [unclassified Desulfovibrio]|uniref:CBS and ACT domain-containing protein n=1 Tax=unclassified Desulfovibrio TaxID=2593640 RepID=UPI000F5DA393|nr:MULTISPECIES: CBS and ACT domain-containing protein [unclassified Desulfovibrio]RRD70196.1 CBS domain-containing protein [Desulfovibrio sp. OH1209_COT-279]RRD86718.1 CBS domain-containing protein [Desulfovibrio sp. OH1186_COT-070]
MPVQDWMTADVVSVGPETSLLKVGKLMKDHNVRRIPVVDERGHVIGIISDRDVRDASPSKATTLDMYEMHYLLAELKAKSIMTAKPVTVKPFDTVEHAALIMLERKVGGLPVVDDTGKLVGIISDHDVFKAMVDITGARLGGLQFAIELPDQPGTARPLFDALRAHDARLLSVLTVCKPDGNRHLFVRVRRLENPEAEVRMMQDVSGLGKVLYSITEN